MFVPSIEISSIIITFKCLYFTLNVFSSSADKRSLPCLNFFKEAEAIVTPVILYMQLCQCKHKEEL